MVEPCTKSWICVENQTSPRGTYIFKEHFFTLQRSVIILKSIFLMNNLGLVLNFLVLNQPDEKSAGTHLS